MNQECKKWASMPVAWNLGIAVGRLVKELRAQVGESALQNQIS